MKWLWMQRIITLDHILYKESAGLFGEEYLIKIYQDKMFIIAL